MPNWGRCRFRWALYVWGKFAECWFPSDIFRSSDILLVSWRGWSSCSVGEGTRIFRPKQRALMAPGKATMGCLQKLPNARVKESRDLERKAMRKVSWSAFLVLSLALCLAIPVMAQTNRRVTLGRLTDRSGARVPDATVKVDRKSTRLNSSHT